MKYVILLACCLNIFTAKAIESEMIERYHFSPNLLSVLRNGVADEYKPRSFRTEDNLKIGFISRLEKTKGLEELLSAYQMIKEKNNHLELIIAGTGSLEEKITKISKSDASVKYLGHLCSGISDLLHEIDIFVLPSYQEGLPYSIIEACMAECAIIATDVGGIPEIIENEKSGLLIPARNEIALYLAIEKLILNNTLRETLAKNARKYFVSSLSMNKMQEHTRNIFL